MTAQGYIEALEKMVGDEAEDAWFNLDISDIKYRHALIKRDKYFDKRMQVAKLAHAFNVLCDPESNEDEIAEAKTVLEDYAVETAKVAESCKNDAEQKSAELRSTRATFNAELAKTSAEEAAIFAAIGSLDKVEADKLKVRVNEIAAGYQEKFTRAAKKCNAYQEEFTKAMAAAERLLA
uniref:Uncharacterized protein n=1 Tax=viral metagenome TaxID=1070528 RepID=A0A6C0AHM3_9ZZZZ